MKHPDQTTPPKPAAEPPALLTAKQCAALLGVTNRTFIGIRDEAWMPKPVMLWAGARPRWVRDEVQKALVDLAQRGDPHTLSKRWGTIGRSTSRHAPKP